MYLSEVTDRLYQSGWKQEEVELIRIDLFEKYPDIEEIAFSQSMSTIPVDPEVPEEWVKFILNKPRVRVHPYRLNPVHGTVRESDKDELIRKVKTLLPDPSSIGDLKERKSIENRLARAEAAVRREVNVGLTVSSDNTKLGKVSNFSLPAGNNFRQGACPGATETCERLCYAKGALFQMNEWKYFVNWAYIQLWPERFLEAWKTIELSKVVRVHAGGDFYSKEYVDLWTEVARSRPEIRFYAYTRSWQDGKGNLQEDFLDALDRLSKVENWRLILSLDKDTGLPPKNVIPAAFRAWLSTDDADLPPSKVGLLFRDHDGMGSVASMVAGSPVCPVERSVDYTKASGKITCQNCGFCWSTAHLLYGLRPDDPSQFDKYARVDVSARTALMFRGVGSLTPSPVANPAANPAAPTASARRGTPEFDELMDELVDGYVDARYPGLTGYAYRAEMLDPEQGTEAMEGILGDIVELRWPEDTHPEFRLKGEDNWRSIEDTEDFPQPSSDPVDDEEGEEEEEEEDDSGECFEDCKCPDPCDHELCEDCNDGRVCCCPCTVSG